MDLNLAAGKVNYLLCKMEQRHQKHVSNERTSENKNKLATASCFLCSTWPLPYRL